MGFKEGRAINDRSSYNIRIILSQVSLNGVELSPLTYEEEDQEKIMTIDNKKLAVIHIVKKELGLSDLEYRDQLEEVTGVRSAKLLDESGFRKLMNYFARSKHYRTNQNGITFRQKMFIKSLKEQLDWAEQHFVNFLKKYYQKSDVDALTKKEGIKFIESLKNVLEHEREREKG